MTDMRHGNTDDENGGRENPGESMYTHELILSTVHSKRSRPNNGWLQINIGRANIGDDITCQRWQTGKSHAVNRRENSRTFGRRHTLTELLVSKHDCRNRS